MQHCRVGAKSLSKALLWVLEDSLNRSEEDVEERPSWAGGNQSES